MKSPISPFLLFGLISGFLIGTSYMPFPPWAAFFGYAPLWIFLCREETDLKKCWWSSWMTQFTLTLIGFNWVAYLVRAFAFIGVPETYNPLLWVASVIALFLFCSLIHLYIPIALTIGFYFKKKLKLNPISFLFLEALLLSLSERIWPSLFPWHLGYTLLGAQLNMAQLSDIIGFSGLSTIVLMFNAIFTLAYLTKSWNRKIVLITSSLLVFLGLNQWGAFRKKFWEQTDSSLSVTLIQGNIGNTEKVYAEKGLGYQDYILNKYIDLTNKALKEFPESDLIVWPETAFPDYLGISYLNGKNQQRLLNFIRSSQKNFVVGAYSKSSNKKFHPDQHVLDVPNNGRIFNSLFTINSNGQIIEPYYNKTHLVAFSEYFPFSDIFPFLLKLPFVSNFGKGDGPMVQNLKIKENNYLLGPQICYEGLYDHFSRDQSQKGAQILINLTNDSWFGWWAEPYQHMYMTLGRALETRRPLIRSTNTGISTVILASGEQLESSPLSSEWYGNYSLKFKNNSPKTFYVEYGHFNWIFILAAIIAILIRGFLKR